MLRIWLLMLVLTAAHGMTTTQRLPPKLRTRLLADAERTFEGEMMMIPAEDASASMTMTQRLLWQRNFQNARNSGLGLHDAQELALRGAVEGSVLDSHQDVEHEEVDYEDRKVTCLACHFEIEERSHVKEHYRCDWHCVNVKRKAAGLTPISAHDFERRLEALLEEETIALRAQAQADARLVAEQALAHSKKQSSKLAHDIKKLLADDDRASHARADLLLEHKVRADDTIEEQLQILRQLPPPPSEYEPQRPRDEKHDGYTMKAPGQQRKKPPRQPTAAAERRAAAEERRHRKFAAAEAGVEEIRSVTELSELRCPFDGSVSADLEGALVHLQTFHAFLPPFLPELADPRGLLACLVRKVYLGFVCVHCGISYSTPQAVQDHMAAKGHCKMRVDDDFEEAYGRFYVPREGASGEREEGEGLEEQDGAGTGGRGVEEEGRMDQWQHEEEMEGGARTLLRMAKRRGKVGGGAEGGRAERRSSDMEALRKGCEGRRLRSGALRLASSRAGAEADEVGGQTMEKLRREGMTRKGWRDASVSKAMLAAPAKAASQGGRRLGGVADAEGGESERRGAGEAMEMRVAVGGGLGGALWLVRRREAGWVSAVVQRGKRKQEMRDGYKNYFTRKASLGKTPMTLLNSGYRA